MKLPALVAIATLSRVATEPIRYSLEEVQENNQIWPQHSDLRQKVCLNNNAKSRFSEFIQPKVSLDEQRMTRAGRRKQIFEKTAKSVNARMNEEGGKSKKISTAGGQPVKKGTADQTKPLL